MGPSAEIPRRAHPTSPCGPTPDEARAIQAGAAFFAGQRSVPGVAGADGISIPPRAYPPALACLQDCGCNPKRPSPSEPIMRLERTIQSRGVCRHRRRRDLPRPRRYHRFDGPAALPSPRKLVPQKHIGSAGGCTARGAERSADDRTHGTGASRPFRASALHPRDRAGYRVSIAR